MQFPASFSLLAVRMWWYLLLVLALLGAAGGWFLARDAQYSATTSFRVDVSSNPIQSVQIVATALQLVDSDPVYARVVGESRDAVNELRSRTTVGVRDTSTVLFATIVAPTSAQAERDADAFAEQTTAYLRELADERFAVATEQGTRSLQTGVLTDPVAEEGRRERLGLNLADGQDSALRSAYLVQRLGGVQDPVRLGVSPTLAVPLGGLAGALLGTAIAMTLGVRRRRVRHVSDLRSLVPHLRVYGPRGRRDAMLRVAARSASLDHPVVALLAMPGAESVLAATAADLRDLLREEGLRWLSVDADDLVLADSRAALSRPDAPQRPGAGPSAALALRRKVRSGPGAAHLTLVTGVADGATIGQVSARADVSVLVAAIGRTRVGQIATVCAELTETSPVVVLGEPTGKAAAAAGSSTAVVAPEPASTPDPAPPARGPLTPPGLLKAVLRTAPPDPPELPGTGTNGTGTNGTAVNGSATNGTAVNGAGPDGPAGQGAGANGAGTNGTGHPEARDLETTRLPLPRPRPSPAGRPGPPAATRPTPSPAPRPGSATAVFPVGPTLPAVVPLPGAPSSGAAQPSAGPGRDAPAPAAADGAADAPPPAPAAPGGTPGDDAPSGGPGGGDGDGRPPAVTAPAPPEPR